jgi:hypothetical protein
MNYSIKVQEKIQLFNRILSSLGGKPLGENEYFVPDPMWNAQWHVEFDIVPKGSRFLPIHLVIDEDFVRFDIANFAEVMVWTNEAISNSPNDLIAFVTNLFSSQVLMESFDGYAELSFLDASGQTLDKIQMGDRVNKLLGKLSKDLYKKEVFPPLYSQ